MQRFLKEIEKEIDGEKDMNKSARFGVNELLTNHSTQASLYFMMTEKRRPAELHLQPR